jgi:hypothetical protein
LAACPRNTTKTYRTRRWLGWGRSGTCVAVNTRDKAVPSPQGPFPFTLDRPRRHGREQDNAQHQRSLLYRRINQRFGELLRRDRR